MNPSERTKKIKGELYLPHIMEGGLIEILTHQRGLYDSNFTDPRIPADYVLLRRTQFPKLPTPEALDKMVHLYVRKGKSFSTLTEKLVARAQRGRRVGSNLLQ